MSVWGKVLGGAAGFAVGGPLGALVGLAAGHAVDRYRDADTPADGGTGEDPTQSVVFTIGVIVLSAKMAKADGIVKRIEIDTFKRLFQVPPSEMANVARIFDLARRDTLGFELYARQLRGLFAERHAVLEELLDSLFLIAEADDELHPNEVAFLRAVAAEFGFGDHQFERILAGRPGHADDPELNPWRVLGVEPDAGDDEVKAAYRALLREHHPDLLVAQGMPEEFVSVATEKTAMINAAYERIKRSRAGA